MKKKTRGQIWVETVIYTLIALVMIGLVLSFVKPKIDEMQDRAIIEQSITIMENIDTIILELDEGGLGNKRLVELGLRKGVLKIDSENDKIVFEMDSKDMYSQPGEDISYGTLVVHTEKIGNSNKVTLTRTYNNTYNITFNSIDELKIIPKAPTPYNVFFSNKGGTPTIIDVELN
ncbi:MAG: hypothetical protein KKF48_03520 [Nanoarchaeota archaeon]|nr:hypothetical protein [Nanoarchaeota archaeon]MBU1028089.1 hypothetical protein [Nanoarchaeota archaeon]